MSVEKKARFETTSTSLTSQTSQTSQTTSICRGLAKPT